jgi:N-acetylmuramoyl-L-alanine amidase
MKRFILLMVLIFAFSLTFAAGAASDFARSRISFENPGWLILVHPDDNSRVTTSSRMSFLGTADHAIPLYINGELHPTTERGFFAYYAELSLGENEFIFANGVNAQAIYVTREAPGDRQPPQTNYYAIELYGSTEYENISRFANLDDDRYGLTPLVRGTTFRILAEHGEFYIIGDGTAVFKSNVFMLDRRIPPITVSGEERTDLDNAVLISFDVTDNPLYEIILGENKAVLTLHASETITREYEFERQPVGFMVDFSHGKMNVKFRFAPGCISEALVLLDAGHGGADPGALGPPGDFGPMEKDFNLYVAQATRDYLERLGIEVVLIRDRDEFVQIWDRVEFFNLEPDIAVCIHANSMPLASDFTSDNGPLMYYTLDLSAGAAEEMADFIAARADEAGGKISHRELSRRMNFAMSRYTGGPSMLFEMGFLCNPEDYEIMLDTAYLDVIAEALGKAIVMQLTDTFPLVGGDDPVVSPLAEFSELYEPHGDAMPAFAQVSQTDQINRALTLYIIFIASVFFCGAALYIPSFLKKK